MTAAHTIALTVPVAIPAPAMTTPLFPRAMFRTGKPVPAVTDRNIIKLSPIPVTDIWTAAIWAPTPEQNLASPAQPPCMTTAKPVPISAPSPAVRNLSPAPMRNAPASGIKPAANPATTGTKALKLAPLNAHPTTNTPVPAPVTPAAQVKPVVENTKVVTAHPTTFGMELCVQDTMIVHGVEKLVIFYTVI